MAPSTRMRSPLVYVMGPSGAGKDSVLNRAREMLTADLPVAFAHRYITRPVDAGGENHVELSPAEFARRRAHGLFALHWQAHGNDYGIGSEIEAWRQAGLIVVVSGSRQHFLASGERNHDTVPVLITASEEHLRARLAGRAREDAGAVMARLQRGAAYGLDVPSLTVIVNDGALDDAAQAFVRLLATLRRPARDDRRRA